MKKILLASTILAASAGVAAAEVTVSGTARMGVTYAEDFANADTNELAFSSRIRIVFTASGETDGGLAFGGTILKPDEGKVYKSKMELVDGGKKLEVSGCIAFICKSQTWIRQ